MAKKNAPAEELLERATANGYKPGAHKVSDSIKDNTKYVKKTLRDQDWTLGRYEKWVEGLEMKKRIAEQSLFENDNSVDVDCITVPPRIQEGTPPLDIATIKDFLRFIVAISSGRIDKQKRITVDSINTTAEWLFAGFARVTGNPIDEEDRRAVYDWTRNTLTEERLVVNKKKKKQLFGEKELVAFNTTFWTIDDAQFIHPRNKAQVPFAIAVFCWTGARIGAFFPKKENRDKGGLRYRDVEVVLKRIPNGGWKVIYRIDQRWVKNNRDPENIAYGASTSQHAKLLYDDTQFLLALALADKAFYGIESTKDLWQLQIPKGEDELLLRWTGSSIDLPILRNATKGHGVSEEPLSRYMFDRILKSVLNLSGYFGDATVHAIRRYLAKGSTRYTEVERSQHITQNDPRVYGQSYVANTSSVCGRSAFLNEPAQHDHIDYFQSFAKYREKGLPNTLPAEREAAIKRDPHVLELEGQVQRLKDGCVSASQIKAAESKMRAYRTCLTKKSLELYKVEWVQKRRDWKITTRGQERPDSDEKRDLLDILSLVMPERGRLTKTMISDKVVSEEERRQAIEDLYLLINQDCTILYRPGEKPINGVCPVKGCGTDMISLSKPSQQSIHIHKCRQQELANTLERQQSELRYCYICFNWFVEEVWDEHCQTHLQSMTSKRCASITYCHTLFRPAFCLFCISDNRLTASSKLTSWTREAKLWTHLESHLEESRWPMKCPHPLCNLHVHDEKSFRYHLSDVHSLSMNHRTDITRQEGCILDPLIWTTGSASRKRKRQEKCKQESQLPKRNKEPLRINYEHEQGFDQSFNEKTSDGIQTPSVSVSSEVPLIDMNSDDDQYNLPSLVSNETDSVPDDIVLPSVDCLLSNEKIQTEEPQKELLAESEHDKRGSLSSQEDALFSLYLRSRSPSHCFATEAGNDYGSLHRQTVNPKDVCPFIEEDSPGKSSVDFDTARPNNIPTKAKKPRIILRVSKPEERPTHRTSLRLRQPKQQLL